MKTLGALLFFGCAAALCIAFPPLLLVAGVVAGAWWFFRETPQQPLEPLRDYAPPEPREESNLPYYERLYKEDPERATEEFFAAALKATGDPALARKALEGWLYEQLSGGKESFQAHRQHIQERIAARQKERERREREKP